MRQSLLRIGDRDGKTKAPSATLAIIAPMRSLVLWLIRLPLYGACAYVALFVLRPHGMLGLMAGALLAAVAIAGDLALSSRLRGWGLEQEAARRVLIADRVLARRGESLAERYQGQLEEAEVVEAEVIEGPSDRPQLER